jgi:hypothetical protein
MCCRNNETLKKWAVGITGCRSSGSAEQWYGPVFVGIGVRVPYGTPAQKSMEFVYLIMSI